MGFFIYIHFLCFLFYLVHFGGGYFIDRFWTDGHLFDLPVGYLWYYLSLIAVCLCVCLAEDELCFSDWPQLCRHSALR